MLTLPVSISTDTINESTSKNKVYTISIPQVLNKEVINQLPTVFKKSTKQDNLPKQKYFRKEYKPTKKYGYLSINDAVTINEGVSLAFVAVANKLCIYYEALQFSYSKQQENAIKSKFAQLKKAKIFEWIDKLPEEKKVVKS